MSDKSQIQALSLEDLDFVDKNTEEENNEIISLLSEMVFTAPYELYVINILNKIINDNFKKIEPLFEVSNYTIEEIKN